MVRDRRAFTVTDAEVGQRLDRFLVGRCPDFSRSQIQRGIEGRHILVNQNPSKGSHALKLQDRITLEIPPAVAATTLVAQDLPLTILYEDSDLLVLDKDAAVVVHPGAGIHENTLANAVLFHCRDLSGIGGEFRPGIVHRLDKGTSGVLVIAKNDFSHQVLAKQFEQRTVEKIYLAFVWGRPPQDRGIVDMPLGRSTQDRKKISVHARLSRSAVTEYQLRRAWPDFSLLLLTPKTGRTHQLRVHLSTLGYPIVGDPTYGRGRPLPKWVKERFGGFEFQLLHAWRLSFDHPRSGERVSFEAPMRREMRELEVALEERSKA